MSNEKNKCPTTANNCLSPKLKYHNSKIKTEFDGSFLIQNKVTFTSRNAVNSFIVYKLNTWSRDLYADFALKHYLLGVATSTKNVDLH